MDATTLFLAAVCFIGTTLGALAQPTSSPATAKTGRIGVYDSRALAFAHFWSPTATKARNALVAEAKAAKVAGDAERVRVLSSQLSELQKRDHLQVFSTAPAEQALVALQEKMPSLAAELQVDAFISKWDEDALRGVALDNRVDVTDRLVRELFTPDERQARTLEAMKKQPPLPLEKARALAEAGKL